MVEVCEGAAVAVSGWVLADRHDLWPCAASSLHRGTIGNLHYTTRRLLNSTVVPQKSKARRNVNVTHRSVLLNFFLAELLPVAAKSKNFSL